MSRINRDQLIALAKRQIAETSPQALNERLQNGYHPLIVDIRERDEFEQGHLPSAIFIPRGFLELRIEQYAFDRDTPIVLYCAGGVRSALAARNLQEMGYTNVESLDGGFGGWKNSGLAVDIPRIMTSDQKTRYSRHILLPDVGEHGQLKLLDARILLVGAGGLGSPAALYLAAAGVGTLGIVDFDDVDLSNLQRQILHGESWLGKPKVESAMARLKDLNPDVKVVPYREPITSANALDIIQEYDIVLNGSDNFPTRYLVNDACHFLRKPLVDASIFMFEGQVTVYHPGAPEEGIEQGPCYRCLYPDPPPPGEVPSCAEAGVLGVLPGIVGSVQAVEAIKLVLGKGESLIGRLLMFDAMDMSFRLLNVRRNPECPVCGDHPTVTQLIDYQQFCGLPPTIANSNQNQESAVATPV
jgi:adenylyltransferase/sulfurtransferase